MQNWACKLPLYVGPLALTTWPDVQQRLHISKQHDLINSSILLDWELDAAQFTQKFTLLAIYWPDFLFRSGTRSGLNVISVGHVHNFWPINFVVLGHKANWRVRRAFLQYPSILFACRIAVFEQNHVFPHKELPCAPQRRYETTGGKLARLWRLQYLSYPMPNALHSDIRKP